eukprot:CAMPEP_0196657142 /NCGR_PEP_ID=MMETSP1086-20130531/22027_1 /TAXON_ID=77921 /ORGANISM="Cyanoptyche  gloeocystis , Strain SAG4.97" /LENGTH=183 /DNA_ID=CAMNT_0041990167 /DNA_START=464 /DNA_END=1015 /DNA_ORIENTATION=+
MVMVANVVVRREAIGHESVSGQTSPPPAAKTRAVNNVPPASFKNAPSPPPVAQVPKAISKSVSRTMSGKGAALGPFTSGVWQGFYEYGNGQKDEMQLELNMENGMITAEGEDPVGKFLIHGSYDTSSLEVSFSKQYLGKHTVEYLGFSDGQAIEGEWEIPNERGTPLRGKFRIWRRGTNITIY